MDLAADIAEPPLDRRVHVLVGALDPLWILRDLGETGLDLVASQS